MPDPHLPNVVQEPFGDAMFDHFKQAKHRKTPPWAGPVLGGVVVLHMALFFTMWVKGIWNIDQLDKLKTSIDLAIAPSPPPPPPPPPGGVKPHDVVITPKKRTVIDLVQPVKIEKQEPKQEVGDSGQKNGVQDGTGDDPNGDPNGVLDAPPVLAPPPPPVVVAPQNVAPQTLEASRIAGDKLIEPSDVTKTEIQRAGKTRTIGSFKLCLATDGMINAVSMLKSTGFPAYDQTIMGRIRSEWRYRPFTVNGKATAVCTAVTFIYSQQ